MNLAMLIMRAAYVGVAPTITGTSGDGSYITGDNVSLGVTATGTAPLTYQWKKDGSTIGGATSSTYSFTSSGPGDSGNYTCVVTNPWGSVTTSNIAVTVEDPVAPSVTVTGGGHYLVGQTVNLNASASGTGPITYDWVSPSGSHYSSSTSGAFTASDPVESGTFTCNVSSPYGSDSDTAAVTITFS